MISDQFGAVCLLRDGLNTRMDTYRLGLNTWNAIANNVKKPAQSDVINQVKNTEGALQDSVYDDALEWMDAFYCSKGEDATKNRFQCTAF